MTDANIVILGGSYAGINIAHYLLKIILPSLSEKTYHVHMVNPSEEFFHRVSAPRSLVSTELLPESKTFFDIAAAFKDYSAGFTFIQGRAIMIDECARSVTVRLASGQEQVVHYHALIVATGARAQDLRLGLQDDDGQKTRQALSETRETLKTAKTVIIGGGGPTGMEVAGEIAEYFNGKPRLFSKPQTKVQVKVFTSGDSILPVLSQTISKDAEDMLARMGVKITYRTRVLESEYLPSGKTRVQLDGGISVETDVYIDATGTKPVTDFCPVGWLDESQRLMSSDDCRVKVAGERVYAISDTAAHSGSGGIYPILVAVPVLAANLRNDLLIAAGSEPAGVNRVCEPIDQHTQAVVIGQSRAVGAFHGMRIPSIIIWLLKGKDYMYGLTKSQVLGNRWKKEVPYRPSPVKIAT